MSIKECYDKMGADFDEVMQRLGSESFIKRFAVKFLDDSSYQMILDGIEAKDAELAFRGAHTLKGVCSNLGFTKLFEESSKLQRFYEEENWSVMRKHWQKWKNSIRLR